MGALRYWHTLRHLKPVQFYGRVRFKLARPAPDAAPAPALRPPGTWVAPAAVKPSLLGPDHVRFLNVDGTLSAGWEPAGAAKLWTYNLHYFADLAAEHAAQRAAWQRQMMAQWIQGNPPGQGTGWEPYPLSLRVVNWVKWHMAGNQLDQASIHSLAMQVRWLERRLEWHLLGNHLFVNAKALVLAGLFFQGAEATRWLQLGARILLEQIPEQVLQDGGQFERSPMYHALAVEDMLDLCNALRCWQPALQPDERASAAALAAQVEQRVQPMRHWLAAMSHPDGEIAFFNDAATGIAPSNAQLDGYAQRLGFGAAPAVAEGLTHLQASGFVRMQLGPAVALLDVAPVGPDYLPGHAHADTLSCELSVHGVRVVVNSGTSEYGAGAERLRQRGTAAHSTVLINNADSSEVWGGFRVARRAHPRGLELAQEGGALTVTCWHDGYQRLPGRPVHRRAWRMDAAGLRVTDHVERAQTASVRWHLAPHVQVDGAGPFMLALPGGQRVALAVQGATTTRVASTYHPAFGVVQPTTLLDCAMTGSQCVTGFSWS